MIGRLRTEKRLKLPNLIRTFCKILNHLQAQYDVWSKMIYPPGRPFPPSRLDVRFEVGTSGYVKSKHKIVLYIPPGNIEDFDKRVGQVIKRLDRWILCGGEIELLHEMMHERQYKEQPRVSDDVRCLYKNYADQFSGPGHDEEFFSAIVASTPSLGISPVDLIKNT